MGDYRDFGQLDDPQSQEGDTTFTGVNARLAPEALGPGLLADGQNARLRSGQPETRLGVVKPGWLNSTRAGTDNQIRAVAKFYGAATFKDPNGSEWVLIISDGRAYRCKPSNERFALGLPAGVALVSSCVPVQAFNLVYLFRGRSLQPLVMSDIAVGFVDVVPRWNAASTYQAAVQAVGTLAQEVAYGPFQAVTTMSSSGQTATVITPAEHGYPTGADVIITGANEAAYNGRWTITVLDVNTFTFSFPGAASPATGVVKVSNMGLYWKALGTRRAVSGITSAGPVATATTAVPHGFSNGQSVTLLNATGVDAPLYNGTWVISGVAASTFQYTMNASPSGPATGGAITAQTSVVLPAQSPDTNPEAWQQIFNVLPNADDALFTDNRLLVPTAYTPGAATYDSTSVYTKKDFIVAMDIGDSVHFFFTNELRINQGSNDEIVTLVKFDADTVIVIKGASWGVLSGLAGGDLSTVRLDMRGTAYGGCAPRSALAAGKNVLFPSSQRGICSLQQNQLGETRSIDVPFSNDLERVVARIDWRLADKIRLAWWDDKLYVAVSLKGLVPPLANLVPSGASYVFVRILNGIDVAKYFLTGLTVGQVYHFTPGADGDHIAVNGAFMLVEGNFVYSGGTVQLFPADMSPGPVLSQVTLAKARYNNNAILVYDFRRGASGATFTYDFQGGAWDGYDTGSAVCVQEFFLATYNGKQRLFFIAEDGYANMMEEAEGGDQVGDGSTANGLNWEPIALSALTRGYAMDKGRPQWFKGVDLGLAIWNANFSIVALTGQTGFSKSVRTNQTFNRTRYLKPIGLPDYVEGNVNADFLRAGRGDYSVRLLPAGITPGYSTEQFQEVTVGTSLRAMQGRFVQFQLTNSQGRIRLKAVVPSGSAGLRREGILI